MFYKIVRNATKRPSQDDELPPPIGERGVSYTRIVLQQTRILQLLQHQKPKTPWQSHHNTTTTRIKATKKKHTHSTKEEKCEDAKKHTHTQMATTLKAPLLRFFGFSRVQNATETHSRTLTEMCLIVELNCRFAQAGKGNRGQICDHSLLQVPRLTDRKACVLDRFHCLLSGWCERQAALCCCRSRPHTSSQLLSLCLRECDV